MPSLGFNFAPSTPDLEWVEYFAEYAMQRDIALAARAGDPIDGEDEEDEVEQVTVTKHAREIAISGVSTAVKAVWLATAALGWEIVARRSRTHHEATLFKSTTDDHNVGDVRWPAKEKRHYFIAAKAPAGRLGFTATWVGEDDPDKLVAHKNMPFMSKRWMPDGFAKLLLEQKNGSFLDAIIYDPVGLPLELYFDYKPNKNQIISLGRMPAINRAERMNYEYNDGAELIVKQKYVKTTTELNLWLDDWLTMLAPEHKRLSRAPKAEVKSKEYDLITTGEWSSE